MKIIQICLVFVGLIATGAAFLVSHPRDLTQATAICLERAFTSQEWDQLEFCRELQEFMVTSDNATNLLKKIKKLALETTGDIDLELRKVRNFTKNVEKCLSPASFNFQDRTIGYINCQTVDHPIPHLRSCLAPKSSKPSTLIQLWTNMTIEEIKYKSVLCKRNPSVPVPIKELSDRLFRCLKLALNGVPYKNTLDCIDLVQRFQAGDARIFSRDLLSKARDQSTNKPKASNLLSWAEFYKKNIDICLNGFILSKMLNPPKTGFTCPTLATQWEHMLGDLCRQSELLFIDDTRLFVQWQLVLALEILKRNTSCATTNINSPLPTPTPTGNPIRERYVSNTPRDLIAITSVCLHDVFSYQMWDNLEICRHLEAKMLSSQDAVGELKQLKQRALTATGDISSYSISVMHFKDRAFKCLFPVTFSKRLTTTGYRTCQSKNYNFTTLRSCLSPPDAYYPDFFQHWVNTTIQELSYRQELCDRPKGQAVSLLDLTNRLYYCLYRAIQGLPFETKLQCIDLKTGFQGKLARQQVRPLLLKAAQEGQTGVSLTEVVAYKKEMDECLLGCLSEKVNSSSLLPCPTPFTTPIDVMRDCMNTKLFRKYAWHSIIGPWYWTVIPELISRETQCKCRSG